MLLDERTTNLTKDTNASRCVEAISVAPSARLTFDDFHQGAVRSFDASCPAALVDHALAGGRRDDEGRRDGVEVRMPERA
jgi:hypothetical protein